MGSSEDQVADEGERRGRRDRGTRANAAAAAAGPAAVRPGHASGTYRPLSVPDIERIHTTALDVLERLGIGEPIPEILRYALPAGCTLSDDDRLLFPRGLVQAPQSRVRRLAGSFFRSDVSSSWKSEIPWKSL